MYELADEYVERFAALDPLGATGEGITGHDHEMTDYSPDGIDERAEHDRATLRALAAADVESDADRIAAGALRERLELALEEHDAGERLRDIRILGSPVQGVRMVFDLMPRDTEEQWQTIAERLALVPQGLSSIETALTEGVQQGIVAARRQAVKCAQQADVWGGVDGSTPPFFLTLVDEYDARGFTDPAFRHRLEELRDARDRGVRGDGALPRRGVRAARHRARPGRDASATRCTPVTSTASSSTSTRRTRGGGRSSTASSTRCARSPSASFPATTSTR